VVGFATGSCAVYSSDTLGRLNYITRIECKNRRGKFSKGRKVSGINFIGKNKILISTNDSRLRLFNLEEIKSIDQYQGVADWIMKYKFKGHKNENLQIEATASDTQDYIISGSEDGYVYIWNLIGEKVPLANSPL
jgi:WD40 repeat protein